MSIHDHHRHPLRDLHGWLWRPALLVAFLITVAGLAAGNLPLP